MKSTIMKKIGTMDNGKFLCAIDKDEWDRLQRREGVRKNVARRTASIKSIMRDIEDVYGLPDGAIRIVKPDGRTPYKRSTKVQRVVNDYQ